MAFGFSFLLVFDREEIRTPRTEREKCSKKKKIAEKKSRERSLGASHEDL